MGREGRGQRGLGGESDSEARRGESDGARRRKRREGGGDGIIMWRSTNHMWPRVLARRFVLFCFVFCFSDLDVRDWSKGSNNQPW